MAPPVIGARPIAPQGRVFVGRPGTGRVFVNRPIGPRRVFNGSHSHVIFTTNPFAFNCGGFFPCTNPFFFSGHFFGSPFFAGGFFPGAFWPYSYSYIPGFSSDFYYPQQPQQQPVVVTSDTGNDVQLAVQMQRLTDEVERLREEQARAARPLAPPGTSMSAVTPAAATTFVFRDGRRITAQNYAIAGETLWIFSEHMAKKFSLADLDRAVTEQVNAANGVEIHLPARPQ